MPISPYLKALREKLGNHLLVLPSVSICHVEDQRILLMQYADTLKWVLPGGVIEPHEHPATAAVREMWEETGLHVELTGILGVYGGPEMHVDYPNGDAVSYVSTIFGCRVLGGDLHPRDGEAENLAYFTQEEALGQDLAPWSRSLMPHLFDQTALPYFTPNEWSPA